MTSQHSITRSRIPDIEDAHAPLERKRPIRTTSRLVAGPVPTPLIMCPISKALHIIHSTRTESKLDSGPRYLFNEAALAVARGMFPPGKRYNFDLVAVTSCGTTAGGVLNQAISFSPAVTTFAEWSSLASLFDEVVLRRAALQFMPTVGSNGTVLTAAGGAQVIVNAVACGYNSENISTSPAGYSAVYRLAKSVQISRTIADHSGVTTIRQMITSDRPWASTLTPAVVSPPTGCVGSFDLANAVNLTASTTYYHATLRCTVSLRMRI